MVMNTTIKRVSISAVSGLGLLGLTACSGSEPPEPEEVDPALVANADSKVEPKDGCFVVGTCIYCTSGLSTCHTCHGAEIVCEEAMNS